MNIFWFSFSISLQNVRKKGPAEFCQMFQLKKLVSRYLQSTVFTFKLKFHLEDGLVEQCYFELFSLTWSIFSSFKRSLLNETVFTLFFTFVVILVKFSAPKSSNFFCGKFGTLGTQKEQQTWIGDFFGWETKVYFWQLFAPFFWLLEEKIWRRKYIM